MAFDATFLSEPRLYRRRNKRQYFYRTTDSQATVLGSGYFAGCGVGGSNDADMQLGDEVVIELVDSLSAPTTVVPLYTAVADITTTDATVQLSGSSVSAHTHDTSDITSGTLRHERGGLEADVSAYSGLVKISGGSTSQAVAGTDYANASHNHAASDINSGTLTHERGGLEADVSAYNGLVKIAGGATSNVTAASGWGTPTGTATRTTFASASGQTISATPTQTEVQNIDDHLVVLSERLMALITDLKSKGYLSS